MVQADEDFIYKKGYKVRLGVLSPAPIFVTVLVEREGGLSPISSLTDVAVSPGKEVILPGSLFLDCSHDTETLQLRFSRKRSVGSETDGGSYSRAIVFKCERQ